MYDAKRGYTLASEKVENPTIKKFLEDKANQRYNFGHELKSEIVDYGKLPENSGSIKGDFHRAWMKLVATISPNESERMLEEVERGEKKILNSYDDLLDNKEWILPSSTRELLLKQREAIRSALKTSIKYEEIVS
jgi:uncharacterized protein (TIGR02284 family)